MIKASEKVPKPSIRKLAEEFNCGKTQISTILQNKHEILDMHETNASSEIYHTRKLIVTRHEKTGLMCTKYTSSYYGPYLLYC